MEYLHGVINTLSDFYKGDFMMVELKFDSKETEDYYWKMRRNLGIGRPAEWNSHDKIITMEDVEEYVKDAKNILSC